MADYTHENLALHGLHLPDYSVEVGPDGVKRQVELPGLYQVGVEIEGVFKPLFTFKAGKLLSRIGRIREEQAKAAPPAPPEQPAPAAVEPQPEAPPVEPAPPEQQQQ